MACSHKKRKLVIEWKIESEFNGGGGDVHYALERCPSCNKVAIMMWDSLKYSEGAFVGKVTLIGDA